MFDVPDAKRVRRSELLEDSSRSSSSPPPPTATTDAQEEQHSEQLHFDLDLDLDFVDISHENLTPNAASNPHPPQPSAASLPTLDPADADRSEAFEFRLFSTSAPLTHSTAQAHHDETTPAPPIANAGIHRISIRSPTPLSSSGNGVFVVPYRPQGYYFTNNTTDPARKAAYSAAAVSSREVLERAKKSRWPGTALPWRVIHLNFTKSSPSSSTQIAAAAAALPAKTKTRRTRAGKKRRLAIRAKYAAMTAQAETEREKRTRRNREKKVKKKEREKTKKKRQAVSKDDIPRSTDKLV